jgi:hypothetical protein
LNELEVSSQTGALLPGLVLPMLPFDHKINIDTHCMQDFFSAPIEQLFDANHVRLSAAN